MKKFKTDLSFLLMLIAISYSVDLHGLSHTFDTDHADDTKQCELCIISHQKDQNIFALQPVQDSFIFTPFVFKKESKRRDHYSSNLIYTNYFLGQFFNRPPPFTI